MTTEQKQLLQSLGQTDFGRALKVYLQEKQTEIGNIMAPQNWEETKGRQIALTLIKELFSFMEEKKVEEKIKKQYI